MSMSVHCAILPRIIILLRWREVTEWSVFKVLNDKMIWKYAVKETSKSGKWDSLCESSRNCAEDVKVVKN